MLISRETLNEALRKRILQLDERKQLYSELMQKYEIPFSIPADICANRKDISEESDFIAFAFLDILDHARLNHYFTKEEIDTYSKLKYYVNELKLPIVFENVVQIASDQWIGGISAKRLMQFKEKQLIKYNENTQRTLQKVNQGENKYFKIALNKKSIREIKEAFENNSYISDDITLNVSPELLEINTKKKPKRVCDIIVKEPCTMDILDGYHRYIALSKVFQEHPNFDYDMEIRIVSFTEEKAKQFIYQKDQKTKMKQIDSAAMNQYSPANTVVTHLNSNPTSNLRGMITKTANIDPAFLGAVIGSYYFGEKRKYSVKETLDISNDLQQKFNQLTTEDTSLLDHEFTERELQIIIFCFANGVSDSSTINRIISASADIDKSNFKLGQNGKVKRKLINELTRILKEEGG